MSLFGSIFGEKGFGKGSHDVAFTAGAGARGMRPGRSGAFFFCPVAPKFFGRAAQSETKHNIGGAPTRALSPRRWKTPSGMSPQTGRSMIEMLAVLAIIGVLTVGGIAAYSFAVAKHRANQIYNQVDLRAVSAFSNPIVRQTQTGNTFFLPGFDDTFENLPYEHSKIGNAAFQIKVTNVPRKVCRRLQDMTFKLPRQVTLNGEDVSSACGTQNTFVFVYDGLSVGKPSSGVTPIDCDCSGCQSCETGTCQDNDNLCGPKEVCVSGSCQCAPHFVECLGSCHSACSEGYVRDPDICDCVPACPDFKRYNTQTGECECLSPPEGIDPETCQCDEVNGWVLFGGTCVKCQIQTDDEMSTARLYAKRNNGGACTGYVSVGSLDGAYLFYYKSGYWQIHGKGRKVASLSVRVLTSEGKVISKAYSGLSTADTTNATTVTNNAKSKAPVGAIFDPSEEVRLYFSDSDCDDNSSNTSVLYGYAHVTPDVDACIAYFVNKDKRCKTTQSCDDVPCFKPGYGFTNECGT